MSFSDKNYHVFEKVAPMIGSTLENQYGSIMNFTKKDVEDYLKEMFDDYNQFVTYTLPDAVDNIRYIQACQVDSESEDMHINVQVGIEEGETTHLVEIMCSEEKCLEIFGKFYDTCKIDDLDKYTDVQF